MDVTFDVTGTLRAQMGGHPPVVMVYDARGNGGGAICPTITGDHESRITDYTAVVVSVDEENLYRTEIGDLQSVGTVSHAFGAGLQGRDGFDTRRGGELMEPVMLSDRKGHNGITEDGTATTLTAQEKDRPIVAAVDCRNGTESTEVNGTLQAKEQGQNLNSNNVCREAATVRRLTTMECERLQCFPDDWSKYGINEKGETFELSDSARYKLQGNSIARPFWTWLLRRIGAEYVQQPTLGSLFEGQGGFSLCAMEAGIKPVWSSEIEKNAIAVTKKHFGEEAFGIKGNALEYLWG